MPSTDNTYFAIRAERKICDAAILFTREGEYPVAAWHQRHDLNMCSILMQEEIRSCDDLIEYLDWQGKCRNKILKLWEFDYDETDNKDVLELFAKCHERKEQIITEAMEEAMSYCDEEHEPHEEDYEDNEDGILVDPSESENWPF
jgi:hypothetical protein